MLVPRTPLLATFSVLVLPLATLAAAFPHTIFFCILGIAIYVAVVIMDALASRPALNDISVELPPVVRLQKDREGNIPAGIRNASGSARIVRFGLPFPR